MSSTHEDLLMEVYQEVITSNIKNKFDEQLKKMNLQDKHKWKSASERWEYALYRIKGGVSKEKY